MNFANKSIKPLTNNKQFIWISLTRAAICFLYSLIFFGMQIKALTTICLTLTFPFLPIAYLVGGLFAGILGNSSVGYAIGAWGAVFVQSYLFVTVLSKISVKYQKSAQLRIFDLNIKNKELTDYVTAYFVSITAATLTFVVCGIMYSGIGNFESATNFDLSTKVIHFAIMTIMFFVVSWIACLATAIIPFIVLVGLARVFRIKRMVLYIFGGLFISILLDLTFAKVSGLGLNEILPVIDFKHKVLNAASLYSISGIVGGFAAALIMCRKQDVNSPSNDESIEGAKQ